MDYFRLLRLKKEPFSNSPDPDFFYRAKAYEECLQRLEISIRLKRGLNLVFGDVGTGKTTLSRILLQAFESEKDRFLFHLILDPSFESETEFLYALVRLFKITPPARPTPVVCKELLRRYLFEKGIEEGKTIVLLIDEGQKLSNQAIEILRELLNFETNEYKLLQLVVFAQLELWDRIRRFHNFLDRVNMTYTLRPLALEDTRGLIRFRLARAGMEAKSELFTEGAIKRIHRYSKGYPRKVITLCHHALLLGLIREKGMVDKHIARYAYRKRTAALPDRLHLAVPIARPARAGLIAALGLSIALVLQLHGESLWERIIAAQGSPAFGQSLRKPIPIAFLSALQSKKPIKPGVSQEDNQNPQKKKEISESFYSIHVASFRSLSHAYLGLRRLTKRMPGGFIVRVELKDGSRWYRVMAGRFKDQKSALEFARRLKVQGLKYAVPIKLDPKETAFVSTEGDQRETRGFRAKHG